MPLLFAYGMNRFSHDVAHFKAVFDMTEMVLTGQKYLKM